MTLHEYIAELLDMTKNEAPNAIEVVAIADGDKYTPVTSLTTDADGNRIIVVA